MTRNNSKIAVQTKNNMTRHILIALFATLLLASCSPSAQKRSADIQKLETELKEDGKSGKTDSTKVKQLLAEYMAYAKAFPTDTTTAVYLVKSALFYQNIRKIDSAIYCYNEVYTKFPDYHKANLALFSEAFLYGNDKHDLVKAKQLYEEYLKKYPTSKMAPSAAMELRTLGKSPEEVLAVIDSMRAAKKDSLSAK